MAIPTKPPSIHGFAARTTSDSGCRFMPLPSRRRSTTSTAPMKTTRQSRWETLIKATVYSDPAPNLSDSRYWKNESMALSTECHPVVSRDAAEDDDAEPESNRQRASELGAERRPVGGIPGGDRLVSGVVEIEGVQAGEHHQHHLRPEEHLAVIAQGLPVQQNCTGDRARHHGEHLPWEQLPLDLRQWGALEGPPEQTEVHHDDEPGEERHADGVGGQQVRIPEDRLPDRDARGHRVDPFEPAANHGGSLIGQRAKSKEHRATG